MIHLTALKRKGNSFLEFPYLFFIQECLDQVCVPIAKQKAYLGLRTSDLKYAFSYFARNLSNHPVYSHSA